MQEFKHVNAKTFEEASRELADGRKVDNLAMAGGTDLMTELRTRIQPVYPDKIVNLKSIEGAEYIEGEDSVKIGALTKLKDVEASAKLPAVLREAAHSVASPLVRNKATIGGNICQDVRCWFYRYPEGSGGALNCARKGGAECYALKGDSRYPLHLRRHEGREPRRLLRRLPEQHGHRRLHGKAPRRRLGGCG